MDIVMCRPSFFDVTRKSPTNRKMNPANPPNKELAVRQWEALYQNYQRYGLRVAVMEGQSDLEDMTFIANAGLSVRGHFILSNFLEEERRGEKEFNRKYFSSIYGSNRVLSLSDKAVFEGQGDALFIDERTLLLGYGMRTNEKAVEELLAMIYDIDPDIKIKPLPFHSIDFYPANEEIFYHLDTCCLCLKKRRWLMIYPKPFTNEALDTLEKLGNVVGISREEAMYYICNSVVKDGLIFTPKIDRMSFFRIFTSSVGGYSIIENDMSEFLKSGGAVKCLSLEIDK